MLVRAFTWKTLKSLLFLMILCVISLQIILLFSIVRDKSPSGFAALNKKGVESAAKGVNSAVWYLSLNTFAILDSTLSREG